MTFTDPQKIGPVNCFEQGSVFTNRSQEHSLSSSLRFNKFERNTTSDWLNHTV